MASGAEDWRLNLNYAVCGKHARNAVLAGIAAMSLGIPLAGAQQPATPEAVSPGLCTVPPLSEAELVDIAAAGTPTPEVELPQEAADGEVDAESIEAIEDTVRESVACANANDPLREFALFTDRYLRERFGGENQDDLGHLLAALTRDSDAAAEADQLTLVSVDELRLLEDGRIAASVKTMNARTTFVDTLIFAAVDDRLLIDEVIAGDPPPAATPAN